MKHEMISLCLISNAKNDDKRDTSVEEFHFM